MYGDLNQIAQMPLKETAFSRPSYVMVCADNEYIHGIQIGLKQHKVTDADLEGTTLDADTTDRLKNETEKDFFSGGKTM